MAEMRETARIRAASVAGLLREVWPRHTAKRAAAAAEAPADTARAWVIGRTCPSAATLLAMAARSEALAAALQRRLHAAHFAARRDLGADVPGHRAPRAGGMADARRG
jgi:hypothetical protein